MTPRGWLGNLCAWHSRPCVLPSHDADDASKIKHTASSKKLAHDRVLHNSTCQLTGAFISSKCIVAIEELVT